MALNVPFFNSLFLFDQMDIVHRHGEYITTIKQGKHVVILYLVDNTFVEVYFYEDSTIVKYVKVIRINEPGMERYVNQVNLADLYQAKT